MSELAEALERMHKEIEPFVIGPGFDVEKSSIEALNHACDIAMLSKARGLQHLEMCPPVGTAALVGLLTAAGFGSSEKAYGKGRGVMFLRHIMELISIRMKEQGRDIKIQITEKETQQS